jgi:uncharacterized protein (TIGR03437 family)
VVALSNPGGNLSIAISSSSPALIALANLNVPAGSPSVDFSVMAQAASAHSILLKASDNGGSVSQSLLLVPANQTQSTGAAQIRSISCGSGSVSKICRVTVTDPTGAAHLQLSLSSSNQSIRLPDALTLEPGQTSTRFRVDAISPVKSTEGIITAQLGMNAIQHSVSFDSQSGSLDAPAHTYVRYGERIRFRVSPSESGSTLSASGVPAGAYFDSMIFQWTPDFNARGTHSVVFTEVHPDGSSLTTTSIIEVDSGKPVVARVVNAASRSEAVCSPRAIVSLEGRWLLQGQDESDMSGNSTELSGTVVRVNGVAAPILSATTSQVDFLCPVAVPGSLLEIVLQTSTDVAQAIYIVSREATPGIFSLDGSGRGQGVIMHSGTATMVMIPNYQYPSRGALPEELVAIYATGIGEAHKVSVIAGGVELPAQSPVAIPDLPGLYQITVRLPAALDDGKESISLNVQMPGGSSLRSNEVWVATEAGQQ